MNLKLMASVSKKLHRNLFSSLKIDHQSIGIHYRNPTGDIVTLNDTEFTDTFGFRYFDQIFIDPEIDTRAYFGLDVTSRLLPAYTDNNFDKTYIAFISEKIGHGLFAKEDLLPGTLIGHYSGHIYRERFRPGTVDFGFNYPSLRDNAPAQKELPKLLLDAINIGNITRFINHSFQDNAHTFGANYKSFLYILFQTKCFVKKHDQITINYGPEYWKDEIPPTDNLN
jgi:SET domain